MSLTNSTNQRSAKEIFLEAIEQPTPADRSAFLDIACNQNPLLRQQVVELMGHHFESDNFMGGPAVNPVTALVTAPIAEGPGSHIGRYKLLQPIGEGGMGVVYMAEQEEPVRRRVALKIIKLGMDTRSVIARFEAERQALALMDHPNIAKVLDAGATESGRPFFVMELVRGIRITDYCDQNHLSTRQRLHLFTQICQAVQHAHQKGIIHRDIKPSNILVTLQDGAPVPKIIDFGVAKAASGQRLTDKTLFTAFEQFIGTPAYMSPEQAEMSGLDIDTRSDIYSLGVLLYELLTGQTPFEAKELLAAGLDAMRRTIREQEPPKPSTRLSAMGSADTADVTNHFRISPTKLAALVRGDLDWIVMKALEKDRARRYETANGVAMDIQRHLDNEPVVARPPSAAYRLQKLVRRNKIAVAATGAVAAALVIGMGISTWMFVKERAERQHAVAAEQRAETVSKLLKDMLKGVGPSVALGRDTKLLQDILDETVERVCKDLTNQPEIEAELLSTIGTAYFDSGGHPKAKAMHEQALKLREALFGGTNALVAESLADLGRVLFQQLQLHQQQQHRAEAETVRRRALAIRRALFTDDNPDVAESLISLSDTLRWGGNKEETEKLSREGLEMWRRLRGTATPDRDVATALRVRSSVLRRMGKLDEAESMQLEALSMLRNLGEKESPALATALLELTGVLIERGQLAEAEATYRVAFEMRRRMLGDNHPLVSLSLNHFLGFLERQDKLPEAEALCRDVLAVREKLSPNGSKEAAAALEQLAQILFQEGKFEEAEASRRRGQQMLREDWLNRVRVLKQLNRFDQFERENCEAWGIPPREADTNSNLIDLSAFYNGSFKTDWHGDIDGNDLSELPTGIQQFAGTRFDVRGLVQIASQQNARERFPPDVTELAIERKCRLLHFLHGIIYGTEDHPGTIVGKYVMHYSSGADEERAIVLGKDALDWWTKPPEPGAVPSLTVAWSGCNPWSRSRGETIQLYKTTWENPRPDDEIVSIDLVSGRKSAAPFLVAITVE